MGVIITEFNANVFINCPFDERYKELLRPLLFTILYLGKTPRIALENSDSAEERISKIYKIVSESQFSIHDISRTKTDPPGGYSRLNMAFELGIDMGARKFGAKEYQAKKMLVLEQNPHDYKRVLSDISGSDIKHHNNEPEDMVRVVRDWFYETVGLTDSPYPSVIWYRFTDFSKDLFDERKATGLSDKDIAKDIEKMSVPEFINESVAWITKNVT